VQLRDLVMGPGTPYRFVTNFNPLARQVRADQTAARTWGDGAWSGAEWAEQAVIPMRLAVMGVGAAGWMDHHLALLAAFAPSHVDLPLTFVIGGREFVMFGRPRLVEPDARHVDGHGYTQAAFVALDPTLYGAAEHQVSTGLPVTSGGLTLPATAPLTVTGVHVSGRVTLVNAGRKTAGLRLRVDGPVPEPRVSLIVSGQPTQTLRCWLTLDAGQWLDIDTAARTAYLNGLASRRGQVSGQWPLLPAGPAELVFGAGGHDPDALLTASWRDAWH
jgi:hypothetical protein